jgi:hypothetical protein
MLELTERLIHRIIAELTADGYLSKHRVGRVNQYRVHFDMPLRRPVLQEITIGEVLQGIRGCPRSRWMSSPSRRGTPLERPSSVCAQGFLMPRRRHCHGTDGK